MRLSAAKGTTQVLTTTQALKVDIAWMGDEENPAMLAASQALPQVGMGSQNRPQHDIILKDEIAAGLVPVVPVRPKLKVPLDPYGKKPRFSLKMLMAPEPVRLTATFLVLFI